MGSSFNIQMQNLRLQRQVEYLREQVTNSKPTIVNHTQSSNEKESAQLRDKPKTKISKQTNSRKPLDNANNENKQTFTVNGDSVVKSLDQNKLSNKETKVQLK